MGAGLWSCGDALSTAAIWGSDGGLVFLLHNQFAVWIPLHITLNIHSSLDLAKSLSSFSFYRFLSHFHLFALCLLHLQTLRRPICICPATRINSHMKLSRIHFFHLTSFLFLLLTSLSPPPPSSSISLQNVCRVPLATADSAPTAF